MNTKPTLPNSGVPSAAGNLEATPQNGQPESWSLEADAEEPVAKPNRERERAIRRAQLQRRQEAEARQNQLPDDPFQWTGMRVRRKRDDAIFTVRTVFKNQRVELEKSWMTYPSDVPTVRAAFERCI